MNIDRNCTVCNEDAQFFCKMCSTHYCTEHLCLHLNVAWENNSWTKRNEREMDENTRFRNRTDEEQIWSGDEDRSNERKPILPSNAKSVAAYTEAELQAQYNFYLSQARRIRNELERRALSFASGTETSNVQSVFKHPNRVQKRSRQQTLRPTIRKQLTILHDQIRRGGISLQLVIDVLEKSVDKSPLL